MLSLLADAPPPAFTGNATLYIVAIVVPVLSLVAMIVFGVMSSRRQPPIAEDVAKTLANYIPRKEHNEEIIRVHQRIDATNADVTAVRTMLATTFADTERAIGSLEGTTRALHDELSRIRN